MHALSIYEVLMHALSISLNISKLNSLCIKLS